MKYPKIHAAIEFLQTDSEGNATDSLDSRAVLLKDALKMEEEAHKRNSDKTDDYLNNSSRLLRLAYKAEYGGHRDAVDACIKLAKLYLEAENDKNIGVPVSKEIACGFLARAKKLLDEKPYNNGLAALTKILSSREDLDLDNVRENGGKKINDLLALIKSHVETNQSHESSVKKQLDHMESSISDKVFGLRKELDLSGDESAHKRRRSRWIRRIIVALILILLLPGCLMGPGEGIQGFFYFLFLIPNTFHILGTYDINSFADYKNVVLSDDQSSMMYGVLLAALPILNLVLTVILYFISIFRKETKFEAQKQKLAGECGIYAALELAAEIRDPLSRENKQNERKRIVALGVRNEYSILDELVIFYHIQRFCNNPDNTYAAWKVACEPVYEVSYSSGGPSLYERYERSKSRSESSGWSWKDEVKITDNWGNTITTDADMAHSLGYIDHDDYMKILAAKDEAEFEHRNRK